MLTTDVSQWVGNTETRRDILAPNALDMLNASLATADASRAAVGEPMQHLAHWCAFLPKVPMDQISTDGHAKLGGFLPQVHLARRMWAGGALEFHAPLHVGSEIRRTSTILSVNEREGSAGQMVFVRIMHELSEGETTCVTETQDIVYLDIPDSFTPPRKTPVFDAPEMQQAVAFSEARLFRFSAATFNAHRIHYDIAYAKDVEKYPGLVVHGPLQAMLLMRAAIKHTGRQPRRFTFRGIHPMFHFDDIHLFGKTTDDGMTLCTGVPESHQGMQATLIWEDAQ